MRVTLPCVESMDPSIAFGLAANIVQFIDFSAGVIRDARDIYGSASGATEENTSLQIRISRMRELSQNLIPSDPLHSSEDEKAVCALASELLRLSDEMLQLLAKLQAKKPNSKLASFTVSAIKVPWYAKEKLGLERKLAHCQGQLEIQLIAIMSAQTKGKLDSLVRSAQADTSALSQLQSQVQQLHTGVVVHSLSPAVRQEMQKLLDISNDSLNQHRILRGLAFANMYGRFDTVPTAHKKTFKWIFKESSRLESDENAEEEDSDDFDDSDGDSSKCFSDSLSQESFLHWLSNGNGIFHISGKPGSGKSTLMKFLCDHRRTKEELQKWSGARNLIFANFFFWKSGPALQKSLEGLFRGLLHDVLCANPALIPDVLPAQWLQAKSIPYQIQTEIQIRPREVRSALTELIKNPAIYKNHSFCFFIDGLDEYQETGEEDYGLVVDILNDWIKAAPEHVKLCVSSREYNVFRNAFSDKKRFRLQDLTHGDIARYIREKLKVTRQDINREELALKIVDKADGVFLWVTLVVKSLRKQLEDGDELTALQQALEVLPNELEKLYEYLLESIGKVARRKAYQILVMAKTLGDHYQELNGADSAFLDDFRFEFELPLISLSFLEDYEKDLEFAMRDSFPATARVKSRKSRLDFAHKQLVGYCQGLLEVRSYRPHGPFIVWIHRSVSEFLESSRFKEAITLHAKDFNPEEAISQFILAEIRSATPEWIDRRILSYNVYNTLLLRSRCQIDCEPYRYLRCLNSAVLLLDPPTRAANRCGLLQNAKAGGVGGERCGPLHRVAHSTSVLEIAAHLGLCHYIEWEIQHDQTVVATHASAAVLLCLLSLDKKPLPNSDPIKTVELFLREGLSPQTPIHQDKEVSHDTQAQAWGNLTLWEYFIFHVLEASRAMDVLQQNETRWPSIAQGKLIEIFLRYGADPRIVISYGPSRKWGNKRQYPLALNDLRLELSKPVRIALWRFCAEKGVEMSLLDMIEFWNLDRKDTIRELILQSKCPASYHGRVLDREPNDAGEINKNNSLEDSGSGYILPSAVSPKGGMRESVALLDSGYNWARCHCVDYRKIGLSLLIGLIALCVFQLLSLL